MSEHPDVNHDVNAALSAGGLSYAPGSFKIRHILDVIINDLGLDAARTTEIHHVLCTGWERTGLALSLRRSTSQSRGQSVQPRSASSASSIFSRRSPDSQVAR